MDIPELDYTLRYKPITTASQTPDEFQGRDGFETPNYATDLLIPFIPKEIKIIWEPANGNGKISNRLETYGYKTVRTDIRFPEQNFIYNFLDEVDFGTMPHGDDIAIVTNPPYSIKEMFINRAMEYGVPWAMLINADYSAKQIKWVVEYECEKIIPNRRVDFVTPSGRNGKTSSSQFHSMWLCHGFNLGKTETFVDLPIQWKKERI